MDVYSVCLSPFLIKSLVIGFKDCCNLRYSQFEIFILTTQAKILLNKIALEGSGWTYLLGALPFYLLHCFMSLKSVEREGGKEKEREGRILDDNIMIVFDFYRSLL